MRHAQHVRNGTEAFTRRQESATERLSNQPVKEVTESTAALSKPRRKRTKK